MSTKTTNFVVANFTVGIVGFYFAGTKTKAESLNGKQFSKDNINKKIIYAISIRVLELKKYK